MAVGPATPIIATAAGLPFVRLFDPMSITSLTLLSLCRGGWEKRKWRRGGRSRTGQWVDVATPGAVCVMGNVRRDMARRREREKERERVCVYRDI